MIPWIGFIFSWMLGILLVISCIGFILAVRELYFITKYDEAFSRKKKLFIFVACLPVLNIITACLAILHNLLQTAKERKSGNIRYVKRL